MFNQPRKSNTLQIFEAMEGRVRLRQAEQRTFDQLRNGYLGEKLFAAALGKYLKQEIEKVFDLTLNIGGSVTQLDSLLFFQNEVHHFEVKYMKGNYLFEGDRWYYTGNMKEIRNPLHQLSRANLLLQEFFQKQQIQIEIKSYLVFVHPNFFLYQAPQNQAIIFPNQLKQFIFQFKNIPNSLANQSEIKQLLVDAHQEKTPFEKAPSYPYENFAQGVICGRCRGFMRRSSIRTMICDSCGATEKVQAAIYRAVAEFNLLFPDRIITVNEIYDWCGGAITKVGIRGVLQNMLKQISCGKNSQFTLK